VLVLYCFCVFVIFFCQAEAGIRGRDVTGVQTCALPIYVYVEEGYGPTTFCVGQVVRMTAKNIWVDTTQGEFYFRKGVMRFILRKNGQYTSDIDGDPHWLYFQPDPLVKFISNGL